MSENRGLLRGGLRVVLRNKRYIVWFYVLNVFLGILGTIAFVNQAGAILDRSLQSERLLHGFPLGVVIEMVALPEFGPSNVSRMPAMCFALLFLGTTAVFLPGVLQGYASTYRLPRVDFFRACGRNLWRFIRLIFIAGTVMGIATGLLFWIHGILERKAAESTNELLLPEVRFSGLAIIFLIMTVFRIWFDLAEADTVLNDQRAVRRSIAVAFRHTFRSMGRLVAGYVTPAIVAAILLVGGLWIWMRFVPPAGVASAFVVSQFTLLFLLVPRFWQRGVAVTYWQQQMLVPLVAVVMEPAPLPVVAVPEPTPLISSQSPEAEGHGL
jgi:hypothetical protein